MSLYSPYRWCIVSSCKNNNLKTPEKLFIRVPNDIHMRNVWLELSGRDPTKLSTKSILHLCEDHFNLEHDMENYTRFKIMGSVKKIKMKPNTVPSRFSHLPIINPGQEVESIYMSSCQGEESTSRSENQTIESISRSDVMKKSDHVQSSTSCTNLKDFEVQVQIMPVMEYKSTQVNLSAHYRSKSTQVNLKMKHSSTSPIKQNRSIATSPLVTTVINIPTISGRNIPAKRKLSVLFEERSESDVTSITPSVSGSTSQGFSPLKVTTSDSSLSEGTRTCPKKYFQEITSKIKIKPRLYIGIPKEQYFFLDIIQQHTNISELNILLCLTKIRLNRSFSELADDFGISLSQASKVFSTNILAIAKFVSRFIKVFSKESIKLNLPIAFRHNCHKITSIIDCFEIEIQKPSNAVHQALTWSEYKKANTIKYLVSCTPDGLISYISAGYGGRVTDVTLIEHSKFLDTLPPYACILADRGFKNIEDFLSQKNIKLMRPPSVASGSKLSKADVRRTKVIASLRIHVERVIRRIREFNLLKPHAVVNINLVPLLDACVLTACSLVNLQDSLVK